MRIWMLLKRSVSLNFESKQAIEVNCSQKYSVILLACCDDWHWRDALSCSTHENIKYQIFLGFRFDVQEYSAVQRGWFSHLWGQYCSPVRVHQCQRKNWTGKLKKHEYMFNLYILYLSSGAGWSGWWRWQLQNGCWRGQQSQQHRQCEEEGEGKKLQEEKESCHEQRGRGWLNESSLKNQRT